MIAPDEDWRECWGCVGETLHEDEGDTIKCTQCGNTYAYLDYQDDHYVWIRVEPPKCEHENYVWVHSIQMWECSDCGENTDKTIVDEEPEDGYVTVTVGPDWED